MYIHTKEQHCGFPFILKILCTSATDLFFECTFNIESLYMQYYIEHLTNCTSLSHRFKIRVNVIRHVFAEAHFRWLLVTYKYSSAFCILAREEEEDYF